MKDNMDRDIPYVSKELCAYLRERFSLLNCLLNFSRLTQENDTATLYGAMRGVNLVIESLEEICNMQEERDGLRG